MGKKSRSKGGGGGGGGGGSGGSGGSGAAASSSPVASYREQLKDARKEYRRGRVFKALDSYKAAIAYGDDYCDFPQDSLVRAFTHLEIGLAASLAITDYLRVETEREAMKADMQAALLAAHDIYESRAEAGTLLVLRPDEAWLEGRSSLGSAVADPERLGAINYASCTQLLCSFGPSEDTVARMQRMLAYVAARDRVGGRGNKGWRPALASSPKTQLNPLRPSDHMVDQIKQQVQSFKAILAEYASEEGGAAEAGVNLAHIAAERAQTPEVEEAQRKFKDLELETKREKDRLKHSLMPCALPGCGRVERHPQEMSRCSGCKAVAYCCKEHQVAHWKEHKPDCKALRKARKEAEEAAKRGESLRVGEAQSFFALVAELHRYVSELIHDSQSGGGGGGGGNEHRDLRQFAVTPFGEVPKPSACDHRSVALTTVQLGALWHAVFAVGAAQRPGGLKGFLAAFVAKQRAEGWDEAQVSLAPLASWHAGRSGIFAIVQHTPRGSVLLDGQGRAHVVTGITDSIEKTLTHGPQQQLPMAAHTTLLPWHGRIIYTGVLVGMPMEAAEQRAPGLERRVEAFLRGEGQVAISELPVAPS